MIHDKSRDAAAVVMPAPPFARAVPLRTSASEATVAGNAAAVTGGDGSAAEDAFRSGYRDADYYSTGRDWNDYAPAYRYGRRAHAEHPGCRFEDVEAALADAWNAVKDTSRLLWAEARGAVLDAWRSTDSTAAPPRTDRATD